MLSTMISSRIYKELISGANYYAVIYTELFPSPICQRSVNIKYRKNFEVTIS